MSWRRRHPANLGLRLLVPVQVLAWGDTARQSSCLAIRMLTKLKVDLKLVISHSSVCIALLNRFGKIAGLRFGFQAVQYFRHWFSVP